jgi:hypothetical protein
MQEGSIPEEEYEFGELHGGRRYKRKKTGVGEKSHTVSQRKENLAH